MCLTAKPLRRLNMYLKIEKLKYFAKINYFK